MSEELRQAFRDYAQMCAALRRFAEDHYHRTNGDYTLIETATEVSRLGQRLERAALATAQEETHNAHATEGLDNDFDEDIAEWDDMPNVWQKPGPFASLRDLVYTECPCGCGSKEVCEAQAARVKANDDAIPF